MTMKQAQFLARVGMLLLFGGLLSWGMRVESADLPAPEPFWIVEIDIDSMEMAKALGARMDVWEVHLTDGYIVGKIGPADYAQLAKDGIQVRVLDTQATQPQTIPDFDCYRTVDELYADLAATAKAYPDLTGLAMIGKSFEGRNLQVLRITNEAVSAEKSKFFLMANIHGRELITPETAMAFIDFLLQGYADDPDIQWVLDRVEIHVLVSANPDGHVKNESGQPWAYWRKNTNQAGCGTGRYGVDLNRNHSFQWSCCSGSSGDPCQPTYRGPAAGSESETQAVQNYVRQLFPDQRGAGALDAAPEDTPGVLISLHSYGDLILWPWGHTAQPAPNAEGLAALGQKMAAITGYDPSQGYMFYPTDGTTDDWSYGELGVASYTFEIGSSGIDGFYPACSRHDVLIPPNVEALFYATKTAGSPYLTARGPDVTDVGTNSKAGWHEEAIALTAMIADQMQPIQHAVYYLDRPPWDGGTGIALNPVDGRFDTRVEMVSAEIPTAGLEAGRHTLYLRGQDEAGYWGAISAIWFNVGDEPPVYQSFLPFIQ